jgi:SAM-dependent methyltransferase
MYFGTRELFEYFSCTACDTLQILNALRNEELERFYPPDYYSYNVRPEPKVRRWVTTRRDRFELHTGGRMVGSVVTAVSPSLRAVIGTHDASGDVIEMLGQLGLESDSRIIDVGCGGGALLDRLARAGFSNLCGADPFIAADGKTHEGVPLMKRFLSEVTGEFDLIMFNHSLEHVPDPVASLKAAREKLAPRGVCLVRLPTTSSEAWTIYKSDWVNIDAPRHTVIPSRQGMAMAADKAGLRVEKTFDDSTFFQFIGSEAYKRDIALTDPKIFWKILRIFGPKQIWDWQRRAECLNRQGRGDWAGFVLRNK